MCGLIHSEELQGKAAHAQRMEGPCWHSVSFFALSGLQGLHQAHLHKMCDSNEPA